MLHFDGMPGLRLPTTVAIRAVPLAAEAGKLAESLVRAIQETAGKLGTAHNSLVAAEHQVRYEHFELAADLVGEAANFLSLAHSQIRHAHGEMEYQVAHGLPVTGRTYELCEEIRQAVYQAQWLSKYDRPKADYHERADALRGQTAELAEAARRLAGQVREALPAQDPNGGEPAWYRESMNQSDLPF